MSKKRIITYSFLVVLLIGGVIVYKIVQSNLSNPSQGKVAPVKISSAKTASSINLTPKNVVGQYASFAYPEGMTVATNSKFTLPFVAQYNYTYQDIESWNLAIDILSIPSGNIEDNNAYQLRKLNPSTYQESHVINNGQSINVMTDTSVGGFSKVAFLVTSQYQATVSLYGDDPSGTAALQSTFNMVLSSWHWHN